MCGHRCYNVTMLHVTIPQPPSTSIPALNHHVILCHSAYCNPKATPAASPHAVSRPPACSPSLTKNLLPPPSSPLKNSEKRVGFTQKRVFLRGSETASGEGKTGARQSQWLIEALFSLYLLLMSFLPNSIKHH